MFENRGEIARRYLIAVSSVAAVFGLTILLTNFIETDVSTVYLAAVMFSAWRGGLGAGLLATVLSVVLATYFFLPPVYSFQLKAEGVVELVVFSLAAILVGSLSASRERALAHEQAARHEAESANRVKDDFVSSVSHELRTPLTTIKALARLLMRGDLKEEKRREYLETISVECDRQIETVLNLLDVSRIEGGAFRLSFEETAVTEVIGWCVKSQTTAAEKRHHKLEIAPPAADVPAVCADSKALRRVVNNLIENAIKYTPDGSVITISARAEKDSVAISVADNGRGISPKDLPFLFDKFHRGKPTAAAEMSANADTLDAHLLDDAEVSGVGLGLYLAKNVMEQMGGRILVESEVGRGSCFTLYLPVFDRTKCGEAIRETET